jgi:hypothetical protein
MIFIDHKVIIEITRNFPGRCNGRIHAASGRSRHTEILFRKYVFLDPGSNIQL